jgi:glycerol uptake facilitator-like aquaporin
MAERLSGESVALALLANTLATGAILVVLITSLGPLSGAHFNPVVSIVMALRRRLPWSCLAPYVAAQIAGGSLGAIFGGLAVAPAALPWLVGLTITAACWFAASTSFANPAVTLAHSLSDSFAGIAPASVPGFVLGNWRGSSRGGSVGVALHRSTPSPSHRDDAIG